MDLKKLIRPQSLAVIGASERSGFGKSTCLNLLKSSRAGRVYFVNPTKGEVLGKKCYPSMSALPEQVDMCVLIVNKDRVVPALEDAAANGCKAAVVYASGYGETGRAEGKAAEQALRAKAAELDLALMGVNCAGFVNNIDDIFAFGMLLEGGSRPGGIGVVSQSGKICLNMMQVEHARFSYLISSGNATSLTVEDYLDFLVEDEHTKVVGLYLEGVRDSVRLAEALSRAAQKRKPVVAMKVGRSAKGGQLASSHTGSLAGSDKSFDALAKKFGLIRVGDIEELIETCHMFDVLPVLPSQGTFASMSLSGGETGVTADVGDFYGIEYPALAPETVRKLTELLPDYASINNPLDMTATLAHDGPKYGEAVKAIMDDPGIGMVVCSFSILPKHKETDVIYPMSDGMVLAAAGKKKPLAVMSFLGGCHDPFLRKKLEGAGVAILPPTLYGFKLLASLRDYVSYKPAERSLSLVVPENTDGKKRTALSEFASKKELAAFGLPLPKELVLASLEDLDGAELPPFPVAVKIESDEILHKSDVGGVKLNVRDPDELRAAFREIMANVARNAPTARHNGVLVSPMLQKGVEIILGVNNDPQFGPMLMCGLGGIFVEIFKDVSLYPAPVNKAEALSMLKSLKGYKMLEGYRGAPPCDLEALTDLMAAVSRYAAANKDSLAEMDLNPVFVHPAGQGISIADALIIKHM